MKFQCNGQQLRNAVNHVHMVTTRHASLPVLSAILLGVSPAGGYVRATNLSVGVEIRFPANNEKEGMVAINGALLGEVLSTLLPDELVTITLAGSFVTVNTVNSESTLKIVAHEDFPILPTIKEGIQVSIPTKEFEEALKSVMYAASASDIKPEISSVYMYTDNQDLVLVSTDSFRLAEKRITLPQIQTIPGSMIPVKNIPPLLRILAEHEDTSMMYISETQISFSSKYSYYVSRLVDGQYPDYRQIIPQDPITKVIVLKKDLVNTLRILNIFSDKFNQVDMTVDVAEKLCTLTSQNSDIGQNTTQLISAITGQDMHIRFNTRYMQDCLGSITTDSVSISLTAPNKPLVISGMNMSDFVYLIMPMNR